MNKEPQNQHILRSDLNWAKHKLDEVLFGCILNIKFYQSGICPRLIIDMNERDLHDYSDLLDSIFTR